MSRKILVVTATLASILLMGASGCDDADVARQNMSKAADNFELMRRVVMYNSITGKNIMVTEGLCSVEPGSLRTSIICKVGPSEYIRNFYGKSDNTVYIVEQMGAAKVNVYHYRRTFKPQAFLPDIDFRGDGRAFAEALRPDSSD